MVKNAFESAHEMRGLTVKREGGEIRLNWKFKEATHFLIFMYDSRMKFVLDDVLEEIGENGLQDEDVVCGSSRKVYSGKKGELKVFCIREKEFVKNGKKFSVAVNEVKQDIPYAITVSVCEYNDSDKKLYVYEGFGNENTIYFPVTVKVEIRYKKIGFLPGHNKKICILKLPYLEGYIDGAIMYHIDGVSVDFPLTSGCLGKDIMIMIPAKSEVRIRIQEEYKKYYKKV